MVALNERLICPGGPRRRCRWNCRSCCARPGKRVKISRDDRRHCAELSINAYVKLSDNSPRLKPGASRPKPETVAPVSKCSDSRSSRGR